MKIEDYISPIMGGFKYSNHEHLNRNRSINIFQGNGNNSNYTHGYASKFVNIRHNTNLIYGIK